MYLKTETTMGSDDLGFSRVAILEYMFKSF